MLGFLAFMTIATLVAPYAQSLHLKDDLRLEEDTVKPAASTSGETISSPNAEHVETPLQRRAPNFTIPNGPGSLCRRQSDCDDLLVCGATSICGCPDLTPVLLYEEDSFTCVAPRRLSESCQNDAECRHQDDHARCLELSCRCQALFYDPGDGSRCLPDVLTSNGLKTTIVSSALLIVAFVALGVLGYQRLHKSWGGKFGRSHDLPHATEKSSSSGCEWLSARLEFTTDECGGRATGTVPRWMHNIATNMRAVSRSFQWPLRRRWHTPSLYESYFMGSQETSSNHYSTRSIPMVQASRILLPMSSATAQSTSSHERLSLIDARTQTNPYASSPKGIAYCSKGTRPVHRRPASNSRTIISTLSTSTLMPFLRANRHRNVNASSSTSTLRRSYSERPQSFKSSGTSSLRYGDVIKEGVDKRYERPRKVPEPANFTESELHAGVLKKFTSEEVAMPAAKRLRRALSDNHSPLTVISEEKLRSLSRRCACHGRPNVQPYRSSVKSSISAINWGHESTTKVSDTERNNHRGFDYMLTHSQLEWPCQHVLEIFPHRRARTCETFSVHSAEPRPKRTRRRIISPFLRRTPRVPLIGVGHRPAISDGSDHWRLRRLRHKLPNRGTHSAIAAQSPLQLSSLSRLSTPSRWSTGRRSTPAGRAYLSAPVIPRAAQVARFSRGSQTLDSALDVAVVRAGGNASDGPYSLFPFSRSDCSNHPRSVSTMHSYRTAMSHVYDVSSAQN